VAAEEVLDLGLGGVRLVAQQRDEQLRARIGGCGSVGCDGPADVSGGGDAANGRDEGVLLEDDKGVSCAECRHVAQDLGVDVLGRAEGQRGGDSDEGENDCVHFTV
jgi:hypothetical protein